MNIKLLPYNSKSTVDINAVDAIAIMTANRSQLPYPPGAVKVNGDLWPNGATYHGDVTLSWAHRNRTAQIAYGVVPQDAASAGIGPEGNYTVEVLIAGVVKQTQAGIAGTSYTYTLAQRTADDADLTKLVQFRLTPVNGALIGTKRTTDSFVMQA